ncbi:6-phospho-3-hexuloisomerase [Zhihengliuella halotolerans]|uniref:3-hexulose-6-phosphate isomerase n=1 Tax=Zhihengliuella halotolerans TaxID=370736 RepID=A0A4Q8AG88_9MICC|nr:6-phospho-3-hexuloisomerase [Zhihengliuella halotolerans]RZU63284.1 3-hexulose-6-phosphate isomerase [Zhihengliuella halotolerans]
MPVLATPEQDGLELVASEVTAAVRSVDPAAIAAAADQIEGANRVFVFGQGRSGIALRGLAMRLMHLGHSAHVVGDATAPAIGTGDVLVLASGSGTTGSVVRAATAAAEAGAVVVAMTATADSPVGRAAARTITVAAAVKTDHGGTASAQYAGSLFEQAVMLVGDAVFHALWQRSGAAAEELWTRHANLE